MYRGALIGLGRVALEGHLPAWKKNSEFQIVAGVDPSPERCQLYRQLEPQNSCYAALDACDHLNLDFVDICTPPYTHSALIQSALKKNLNVLCEKPLVFSQRDLESIQERYEKSSRVLFTVHNWKFAPLCLKVSELVREKVVGDIQHCAWYVLRSGPAGTGTGSEENWRLSPEKSGGGILIDHGWHAFYLISNWLNSEPSRIHATLENRQYESWDVEDTAKIKLEFDVDSSQSCTAEVATGKPVATGAVLARDSMPRASGDPKGRPLTAEIFLTWASRLRRNWGVIQGNAGAIQIEDRSLKVMKKDGHLTDAGLSYSFEESLSGGSYHSEWFQSVILEFFNELQSEGQRGKNFKMAKSCLQFVERSKESHNLGKAIPF